MALPDGARIRTYREGDAPDLCRLFFETVRSVNLRDYSPEQVVAWAPFVPDADAWHRRMSRHVTLVAEDVSGPLGFIELDGQGLVDMLYCRMDRVRRGIGSALYVEAEARARGMGVTRLTTHASVTARPFFEKMGFAVLRVQTVERMGAGLRNFRMEKLLEIDPSSAKPGRGIGSQLWRWLATFLRRPRLKRSRTPRRRR